MSELLNVRSLYSSDLTDKQFELIESLLPAAKIRRAAALGKLICEKSLTPSCISIEQDANGTCSPHDLLPKSTVYDYFAQWRDDGTWERMITALRMKVRTKDGRKPTPSAVCIDSQSVKTTEVAGDEREYDGGKKIKGEKASIDC